MSAAYASQPPISSTESAVLPHFACCRDGKVFCKPLNELAIFGMWQERLAHTELNKRCRCKFRFHINNLYSPTACRQHANCGRTESAGEPIRAARRYGAPGPAFWLSGSARHV